MFNFFVFPFENLNSILKLILIYSILIVSQVYSQNTDTLWTENWEGDWTTDWHVDKSERV
ncbi:MAG: hypothetical protein IPH62_16465 [Ignavibacteriae bacterium]|nr:hypothetical protein [Ignavibacteriota bacterium]